MSLLKALSIREHNYCRTGDYVFIGSVKTAEEAIKAVKAYNGNILSSIYGKAVTLCSQDTNRHKFVITKSGNTFTFYNESMTQLDAKTFDSLATVTQTLILGCSENTTGYKGPYVKGTLHRLKIVQGVMSREDCLAWMA